MDGLRVEAVDWEDGSRKNFWVGETSYMSNPKDVDADKGCATPLDLMETFDHI